MGLLDWLKGETSSLGDLSLEEVKKEKRRMNIREGKALKRLEKLEAQRDEVFRKGAKVNSDIRRRQLARKYKQKKKQIRMVERKLNRISKQLLTLSAVGLALERQKNIEEGLTGILQDVREEEIRTLLEDDKISYDMYMDKLDKVLKESSMISDEEFMEQIGEEGREVLEAWEAMDEGEIDSMEEAMETVEEEIREKEDQRRSFEEEIEELGESTG